MTFLEIVKKLFISGGRSVSQATKEKIKSDWEAIEVSLKQKTPSQLKQALITADKSMDNALKDIVEGETMGERLKNARNVFNSVTYNKLWEAHKVRNSLVHESGYEPPYYVLTDAIEKLRRGLNSLNITV